MHEVTSTRELAITMAQELMAAEKATGVKVIKETYNDDTGDYLTLKIFEEGHNQVKVQVAQEDAPHALPCFKPDDLYSYHARAHDQHAGRANLRLADAANFPQHQVAGIAIQLVIREHQFPYGQVAGGTTRRPCIRRWFN